MLVDTDGNGNLDLVAGNFRQTNRLYLNSGTANSFSGVTGSDISSDAQNNLSIALADMDRDGDLDLVAGISGTNRLYLNNGTSDPFNGITGSNISSDTQQTYSIALGDVDGDGDLDLVAGNHDNRNRLYLNNGTSDPFSGVTGSDITIEVHATCSIALGDVDRDGDLDLVAGNWGQTNRLYLNNGSVDPFNGVTGTDISSDAHYTTSIALGDVDGDSDLDLVAGNYYYGQTSRLYLNNGSTDPFFGVSGTNISSDIQPTNSLALGDVDGDSDLDLVAGNTFQANRLYLNNGTEDPFSGVTGSDISGDVHNTYSIALSDVDHDGDLDLVAGNYGTNRLYLNNGTSDPFYEVIGADISSDAHYTTSIALGDVDGDGDLDLLAGNLNQPNRLYLNNVSADPFNSVTGSNISSDAHDTISIALGDVDRDGDLDMVAGNYGEVNRLYLNNGTAAPFSMATGLDISSDAHYTTSIVLGDVDGDGDLDLVAGNYGEVNRLYLNNGTEDPFSGVTGSDISGDVHNTYSIALSDVDHDGDLDLVAGNYRNQPPVLEQRHDGSIFRGDRLGYQ